MVVFAPRTSVVLSVYLAYVLPYTCIHLYPYTPPRAPPSHTWALPPWALTYQARCVEIDTLLQVGVNIGEQAGENKWL